MQPTTTTTIQNQKKTLKLRQLTGMLADVADALCKSCCLFWWMWWGKVAHFLQLFRGKDTILYTVFNVVEPVEFVWDWIKEWTFQYIPLLQSLQQRLGCNVVVKGVINSHGKEKSHKSAWQPAVLLYKRRCILPGKNIFLSDDESKYCLSSYLDDFELCHPSRDIAKGAQIASHVIYPQ